MCNSAPVIASQTRTVRSSDPETTLNFLPLPMNATDVAHFLWPVMVCSCIPVALSHTRTVQSSEPETTYLPSPENAIDRTISEWPSRILCQPEGRSDTSTGKTASLLTNSCSRHDGIVTTALWYTCRALAVTGTWYAAASRTTSERRAWASCNPSSP
jgi:hypothetical protein